MCDNEIGPWCRPGANRVMDGTALLKVVAVDLRPGNTVARAMLGG